MWLRGSFRRVPVTIAWGGHRQKHCHNTVKTGITRGGFVKNVSIDNVEIVGTTKEAIRIDA
eukprot:COSAG02_NODE_40227_length_407_cov_33.094156_1_plen_60_part_01